MIVVSMGIVEKLIKIREQVSMIFVDLNINLDLKEVVKIGVKTIDHNHSSNDN
jgi:hypothetical protein